MVAIFASGFLLAHTINITQEMSELKANLARTQDELRSLDALYQAAIEEKNILIDQNTQLSDENTVLNARIKVLETERQTIKSQLEILQERLTSIEKTNSILTWLGSSAVGRVATILSIPIVPLSFGTIYMISCFKKNSQILRGNGRMQDTYQILLTREEIQFLARRRRSLGVQNRNQ
jgi:predicted RNase H-like nuclease (RuvC/YqgF family)